MKYIIPLADMIIKEGAVEAINVFMKMQQADLLYVLPFGSDAEFRDYLNGNGYKLMEEDDRENKDQYKMKSGSKYQSFQPTI